MENTENRNERNPLPLLLLARSDSFFFPPLISFIPLPLSTILARVLWGKLSRLSFFLLWILSFYWLRKWRFFFLYVEHEEKWKTRCHYTPTHEDTAHSSVGCLVSSKNAFFATSQRTLRHWRFPAPFEWNLWTFIPFFLQLSILISRKLSVSHNGFFYFTLLPATLYYPTHSCPSSSCSLPSGSIVPLNKRASDASGPGKRWSSLIDKFLLGGGHQPHFFFRRIHLWSFQMLQIWCRPPAGNLMPL